MYLFERRLAKFRQTSPAIQAWIDGISREKWSLACDIDGGRFGHMTTNLAESVNKVFKGARNMPITALVKCTYARLVDYFVQRGIAARDQLQARQVYCHKVMVALAKNHEKASAHMVRTYNVERTRFEVEEGFNQRTHRNGYRWSVRLDERTCECGRFQAFKYPCDHVIAACARQSINYYDFVDPVYKLETVRDAYKAEWWALGNDLNIPPAGDGPRLIPDPTMVRVRGRPRSTRIRNEMDLREPQPSRRNNSLQR